jgi:hypothetical protein
MKKYLLILFLCPLFGFAQIKEIKDTSIKIGKLENIECLKTLDGYVFVYDNFKYKTLTDIQSFTVSPDDFETLFTKLNESFERKDNVRLEMPGNILEVSIIKVLGVTGISIANFDKSTTIISTTQTITKKQLAKLFGKA